MMIGTIKRKRSEKVFQLYFVHGPWHYQMLGLYMILVIIHGIEHILQLYQVIVLGWPRPDAGGLLGLWLPQVASAEVLHFAYNLFQLMGLLILLGGFKGQARSWWIVAIILQSWHFFEHLLLQVQWLTGIDLFNQPQQTSILQMFVPRLELHFIYNMLVLVPILVSVYLYLMTWMKPRFKGTEPLSS